MCSFTIYSEQKREGQFRSATYPGVYPKNLGCTYRFIGRKGQRVRLEFMDFDLFFGGKDPLRGYFNRSHQFAIASAPVFSAQIRSKKISLTLYLFLYVFTPIATSIYWLVPVSNFYYLSKSTDCLACLSLQFAFTLCCIFSFPLSHQTVLSAIPSPASSFSSYHFTFLSNARLGLLCSSSLLCFYYSITLISFYCYYQVRTVHLTT